MSDDQMQIDVPVNRPDDCSAEQPLNGTVVTCPVSPVEDGAACPVPQPNDETEMSEDIVLKSKSDNNVAILASPPNHDVSPAPPPNSDASPAPPPNSDASPAPPPNHDASPAPPPNHVVSPVPPPNHVASPAPPPNQAVSPAPPPNQAVGPAPPPPSRATFRIPRTNPSRISKKNKNMKAKVSMVRSGIPKIEPGSSRNGNSAASSSLGDSYDVKRIIKQEVVDLGNDPYYYDGTKKSRVVQEPKVGYDRGLEPDHIVGATEQNGKLMFLIAWKNSEVADLLEAAVVYKKSPQIAIQFFEQRLTYKGPDK